MIQLNENDTSNSMLSKVLKGMLIPRPVVWILTESSNETYNIAPFSYVSIVSSKIPLISVSIARIDGEMKDTSLNIMRTRRATVHSVGTSNLVTMHETSIPLPYGESEQNRYKIRVKTDPYPYIEETKICMDTHLFQHLEIKDSEDSIVTDHFILKINAILLDENIYDLSTGYVDFEALEPVARLAGDDYATVHHLTTLVRPK